MAAGGGAAPATAWSLRTPTAMVVGPNGVVFVGGTVGAQATGITKDSSSMFLRHFDPVAGTWADLTSPPCDQCDSVPIPSTFAALADGEVYLGTSVENDPTVFMTKDSGASWQEIDMNGGPDDFAFGPIAGFAQLADGDLIAAASFSFSYTQGPLVEIQGAAVVPSVIDGAEITTLGTYYRASSLVASKTNLIYAATPTTGAPRIRAGHLDGTGWSTLIDGTQNPLLTGSLSLVVGADGTIYCAEGKVGVIVLLSSSDAGTTWAQVASIPVPAAKTASPPSIAAAADGHVFVAYSGILIASADGKTWVPTTATLPFSGSATYVSTPALVAVDTSSNLYVAGNVYATDDASTSDSVVWKSTDDGSTFVVVDQVGDPLR